MFSSNKPNNLNIIKSGSLNFNDTSSTHPSQFTHSMQHDLGFTPLVIAFVNSSFNGNSFITSVLPYAIPSTSSQVNTVFEIGSYIEAVSDEVNVTFTVYVQASKINLKGTITYYLLQP